MLFNIVCKRFFSAAAPKATPPKLKPTGMHAYSPYVIYVKEQMALDKGDDVTSRMKTIARQWNALNPTQKKKYIILCEQQKGDRLQEFEKLSLKDQMKEVHDAKEAKLDRAQRRERKERRQMWEATNHPQRPPTGMALFVKEQFELKKKRNEQLAPVTEHLKNFATQWKAMSDDSKKKYTDESQKLRDAYKTAVVEWQKTQQTKAKAQKLNS